MGFHIPRSCSTFSWGHHWVLHFTLASSSCHCQGSSPVSQEKNLYGLLPGHQSVYQTRHLSASSYWWYGQSSCKLQVFSTFNLKSAYQQVLIAELNKIYTCFEVNGKRYQFHLILFGLTDVVAVFERAMDKMVEEKGLNNTFPYLDNLTIAGVDQ